MIGAILILLIGIGLLIAVKMNDWVCPRCGAKHDMFTTPWRDERGISCDRCWEVGL